MLLCAPRVWSTFLDMEESSFGHGPKIAALVGTLGVTALVAWWLRPQDGFGAKKAAGAAAPDLNSLFQSFVGGATTTSAPGAASTHAPAPPVPNLGTLLQSLGNVINAAPTPVAPHAGKSSSPPRAPGAPVAAPASGSAAAPKSKKKSSSATSSASSNTPAASPNASSNTFESTTAPTDTSDDGGELLSDELNPFYTG